MHDKVHEMDLIFLNKWTARSGFSGRLVALLGLLTCVTCVVCPILK